MIDSHCHLDRLDLTAFDGDLNKALIVARQAGLCGIVCVCISTENFPAVLSIAQAHHDVWASFGVHPCDVDELADAVLSTEAIIGHANQDKVVALGETGLDYYRDPSPEQIANQKSSFIHHIEASLATNKPLIIHTRSAREDTIALLKEHGQGRVRAVLHCFTESLAMAQEALAMGLYISFSGIITFKNAESLREVVKAVPLERLLIETDAPYLTPVPFRGKPNQPAYVQYVAQEVARIKAIPVETVIEQTRANTEALFQFK